MEKKIPCKGCREPFVPKSRTGRKPSYCDECRAERGRATTKNVRVSAPAPRRARGGGSYQEVIATLRGELALQEEAVAKTKAAIEALEGLAGRAAR